MRTKTVLLPVEVDEEIFAALFNQATKQPQPAKSHALDAQLQTRTVAQTIDDVYDNKNGQVTVVYHMSLGDPAKTWEYWVPKSDEGFIANSIEVGKSYDITMEKQPTKSGKSRYRWTKIEPR